MGIPWCHGCHGSCTTAGPRCHSGPWGRAPVPGLATQGSPCAVGGSRGGGGWSRTGWDLAGSWEEGSHEGPDVRLSVPGAVGVVGTEVASPLGEDGLQVMELGVRAGPGQGCCDGAGVGNRVAPAPAGGTQLPMPDGLPATPSPRAPFPGFLFTGPSGCAAKQRPCRAPHSTPVCQPPVPPSSRCPAGLLRAWAGGKPLTAPGFR